MSSVVISGDTSGAITLAAPAVSGTNTATLPAATGTVMVSGNMPAFSAYASGGGTTVISNGVFTKVTLNAKTFDTNSCFDAVTNYRFTPNVAGYYQINATVESNWNTSQFSLFAVYIYKNGSSYSRTQLYEAVSAQIYGGITNSNLIYMNGTTDYLELYVITSSGVSVGYDQGSPNTYMTGYLVRAA